MANIAITKYCNLKCPYCFAAPMMTEEEKKNISLGDFDKIINWIGDSPIDNRIGIIGGEPTLHPNFIEILTMLNNYCEIYNKESIIFSNGVYLEPYLKYLSPKMGVLINVNTPNAMSKEQWEKMVHTLDTMYENKMLRGGMNPQATLGCNLCPEIKDYSFFWKIAEKYQVMRIRVSVTAPIDNKKYLSDKEKYYLEMKEIFLNFCIDARKRNIELIIDCNHIPDCYFSEEEQLLLKEIIFNKEKEYESFCSPCVDITADFKATSCFGTYKNLIDCNLFDNCQELYEYFYKKNVLTMQKNNTGKCKNCLSFQLMKCQGGCLSFCSE